MTRRRSGSPSCRPSSRRAREEASAAAAQLPQAEAALSAAKATAGAANDEFFRTGQSALPPDELREVSSGGTVGVIGGVLVTFVGALLADVFVTATVGNTVLALAAGFAAWLG
ncbi:MAG: hypothetical protein INH41_24450 [Myxococcaceae bacterium]|jgi:hypothetical protein|nr:hypothetical protein [Myxococcaceae bacterium]